MRREAAAGNEKNSQGALDREAANAIGSFGGGGSPMKSEFGGGKGLKSTDLPVFGQ